MKTEGKLVAKRKWWNNHAQEKIIAREKLKSDTSKTKKAPKKQKYISQYERRNSVKGKAFTKFYFYVYFERKIN